MFDFAGYLKRRIGYDDLHKTYKPICCKCICNKPDPFNITDTSGWDSNKLREEAEKAVERLRRGY